MAIDSTQRLEEIEKYLAPFKGVRNWGVIRAQETAAQFRVALSIRGQLPVEYPDLDGNITSFHEQILNTVFSMESDPEPVEIDEGSEPLRRAG